VDLNQEVEWATHCLFSRSYSIFCNCDIQWMNQASCGQWNLFHLLTVELLMDQLVQSFQIQTPICLDQFLQIGKKEKEKNCYKCYRDGRYFMWFQTIFGVHTTACVINFKPKNHFVFLLTGLLQMIPLLPKFWLNCTTHFLLIEMKLCVIVSII